jgi:serine protease Do
MVRLSTRTFAMLVIGAALVGAVVGGYAVSRGDPGRTESPAVQAPVLPVQLPVAASTFARVAEAIKPAVININTYGRPGSLGRTPFEEFFGDEFFKRFFGDMPERIPQRSLGSGVIVDPAGIALTNAHVVERASEIEVITLDGRKHRARVIGRDPKTDLAVLKLDDGKATFASARLGDSDKIQVGDWVLAIGSPFGLQATVTAGIISAKARQIGQGPFDDFLQTDAAINPGNSGGPLVNMSGEVVGINTAIVAGGTGIGFAIPANMARKIYTELVVKGKVSRGWLGVTIQPLSPDLASSFGAPDSKGVLIADVMPSSPAARAGLEAGDILLEFDGKRTEGPADLQRAVGLTPPGSTVRVKIWRDHAEKTLTLRIADAPADGEVAIQSGRGGDLLGLEVRPITPERSRQLRLRSTEGVIVARVQEGSSAAEAGVQPGDVIREINRQRVRGLSDFDRLTRGLKEGDRLTVLLQRGVMSLYVAFTIGEG